MDLIEKLDIALKEGWINKNYPTYRNGRLDDLEGRETWEITKNGLNYFIIMDRLIEKDSDITRFWRIIGVKQPKYVQINDKNYPKMFKNDPKNCIKELYFGANSYFDALSKVLNSMEIIKNPKK